MMLISTKFAFLGIAALSVVASHANAAILAQYPFDSGSAVSTDTDPNSVAGNFTATGTVAAFSGSSGSAFIRSNGTGSDAASAAAPTNYFEFTITAAPGFQLNLDNLALKLGASNANASGVPTFDTTLFATAGGSSIGSDSYSIGYTDGTPTYKTPESTFDLSGPAYQGLTSLTFRLAFADNVDNNDVINRLDDVVVNGTATVVPEPTAMALLGLGSLCALRRRRAM